MKNLLLLVVLAVVGFYTYRWYTGVLEEKRVAAEAAAVAAARPVATPPPRAVPLPNSPTALGESGLSSNRLDKSGHGTPAKRVDPLAAPHH